MPAKKVYLCRHGQDEDNANLLLNGHRDMPLTALGQQQAQAVAAACVGRDIDVILTSPLQRARHTAQAIADCVGLVPIVTHEIIERDFGVLTGRPLADIPTYAQGPLLHTEKVTYFLAAEGAETFPQLLSRAERFLARLHEEHHERTVLLVCHGDIGKMLMAAQRGLTWEEALRSPYIANTQVIEL